MEAISVAVRRRPPFWKSDLAEDLRRARILANLLDAQFSIAGFKFGLDPIVGLIPGIGDGIMALAGMYPIYLARKHDLGKRVEARMAMNLAIDFFAGSVPLVGDFFDAAFKANLKNLALLERAVRRCHGEP